MLLKVAARCLGRARICKDSGTVRKDVQCVLRGKRWSLILPQKHSNILLMETIFLRVGRVK